MLAPFRSRNLALLAAVIAMMLTFVAATSRADDVGEGAGNSQSEKTGMLRHVVLLKFKDETKPDKVQEIVDAFRALPKKIDTIMGFEWGTDNSPEMLAQGFTHCFVLTFADEKGRETYLPHPAHKEFGALLKPHLDKVLVVDFFAKE